MRLFFCPDKISGRAELWTARLEHSEENRCSQRAACASPALEPDERCLRRNSLDCGCGNISIHIQRVVFCCVWAFGDGFLCSWRLMHSHNFSFQVASRNYPLDPCYMPDDESDLSLWIFMKQRSFSAKIKQVAMAYSSPNVLPLL